MNTRARFPLRQGNLDFLCSTYAAINAMHHRREITELDQAAVPFRLAINYMQAHKDWDLAGNICFGHDEQDYPELLRVLSWRDWQEQVKDPTLKDLESVFRQNPKTCALISLVAPESVGRRFDQREALHYTVMTGVDETGIRLADSLGVTELPRKGKGWRYAPKGHAPQVVAVGCLYAMAW